MLPELIEFLVAAARAGDVGAQKHFVDRVLGGRQTQRAPVADDIALPMDHPGAAEHVQIRRRRMEAIELATPATEPEADAVLNIEHTLVEAETGSLADEERDTAQSYYMARNASRDHGGTRSPRARCQAAERPSTKTARDGVGDRRRGLEL